LYSEESIINKDLFASICNRSIVWVKEQNYNFKGAYITYFSESNRQNFELSIKGNDDMNLSQENLFSKIKEETITK